MKLLTKKTRKRIIKEEDIISNKKYNYSICKCCNPIPMDSIVGYLNKDNIVDIHRSNCKIVPNESYKVIDVKWNSITKNKYLSKLLIYSNDDNNLYNIIEVLKNNNIMLDSIETLNKGSKKVYSISIIISNKIELDKTINEILSINSIYKIERELNQ